MGTEWTATLGRKIKSINARLVFLVAAIAYLGCRVEEKGATVAEKVIAKHCAELDVDENRRRL